MLAAMGQEAFQNQVLAKFPLTLSDEDVRNIAAQFGWQEEWNQTKMSKRAKAKAAIAMSSDVGQMLSGHLNQATGQVPPQVPQQSQQPRQVHQMVPPVQMPPPVLQPPPPAPAHRLQVQQQPQQIVQQQHPVRHHQVPQRVQMQVRQQQPRVQEVLPQTPVPQTPAPAAHPIPASFSKSAPTTPRNPRNLDGQFLAATESGATADPDGSAVPSSGAAFAEAASIPSGAEDFLPSLMALMDGSPNPPDSVQADEVEGSGDEPAALCCICHDVLITPGMEVEALGCGHVFHSECLSQCRNVGGFSNQWCPFKCHESTTSQRHFAPEDDTWEII